MVLDLRSGAQIMAQIGQIHLQNLFVRDPQQGGRLVLMTGYQGVGKTTLLEKFAQRAFSLGDYVVWRGRDLAQWHRFPDYWLNVTLFVHEDDDIKILKLPHDGGPPEEIDNVRIVKYREPQEVVRKLRKTKINVIYEPSFYSISERMVYEIAKRTNIFISPERRKAMKASYFWYEFMYHLLERPNRRWVSVFFDEFDDIAPETPKGLQWVLQEWMMHTVKDLRKAFISLFASTHVLTNVDWRIRSKFQIRIYLQGAQIEKGSIIRKKQLTQQLPIGVGIIEWGTYGLFRFDPLPPTDYDVLVKKEWHGELPDMTIDDVPAQQEAV